jgi:hypothetical protein
MNDDNRDAILRIVKKYNVPLPLTIETIKERNSNKDQQWIDVFCFVVHFDENTGKRQLIHAKAVALEHMLINCDVPDNEHVFLGWCYNEDEVFQWPENCGVNHPDDIDCYRITDGKIQFCPQKTKKVIVERLRSKREEYFKLLDIQFMRNLEEGKDNSEVLRQKRILRDMPNHPIWENCITLDDFKNITIQHLLTAMSTQ